MYLTILYPILSVCKYTIDFQYTKKKLPKCIKTRMMLCRPFCGLSGYTQINECETATFSVISEKVCIFAS